MRFKPTFLMMILSLAWLAGCAAPLEATEAPAFLASALPGVLVSPTPPPSATPTHRVEMTDTPGAPTRTPLPVSPEAASANPPGGPLVITVLPVDPAASGGSPAPTALSGSILGTPPSLLPLAGRDGQPLPITLADSGRQVSLAPGQQILFQLSENYTWKIQVADPAVLGKLQTATPPGGSQGVFEARQPGQTSLTAVGDPLCRSAKPPCAVPSIRFQIEILVQG